MTAAAAARLIAQFNMDAAVTTLLALAADKRASRPRPENNQESTGPFEPTPFRIFSMSDFPEPSAAWTAAHDALRLFANEIADVGGLGLMVDVYDEAVERHGYHAVGGVSASWDGLHGWMH